VDGGGGDVIHAVAGLGELGGQLGELAGEVLVAGGLALVERGDPLGVLGDLEQDGGDRAAGIVGGYTCQG
jgi:hypothetical protein